MRKCCFTTSTLTSFIVFGKNYRWSTAT